MGKRAPPLGAVRPVRIDIQQVVHQIDRGCDEGDEYRCERHREQNPGIENHAGGKGRHEDQRILRPLMGAHGLGESAEQARPLLAQAGHITCIRARIGGRTGPISHRPPLARFAPEALVRLAVAHIIEMPFGPDPCADGRKLGRPLQIGARAGGYDLVGKLQVAGDPVDIAPMARAGQDHRAPLRLCIGDQVQHILPVRQRRRVHRVAPGGDRLGGGASAQHGGKQPQQGPEARTGHADEAFERDVGAGQGAVHVHEKRNGVAAGCRPGRCLAAHGVRPAHDRQADRATRAQPPAISTVPRMRVIPTFSCRNRPPISMVRMKPRPTNG